MMQLHEQNQLAWNEHAINLNLLNWRLEKENVARGEAETLLMKLQLENSQTILISISSCDISEQ